MKEYSTLKEEAKYSLPANAMNWIATDKKKQRKVLIVKYTIAVFKSDSVYVNQPHKPLIKDV